MDQPSRLRLTPVGFAGIWLCDEQPFGPSREQILALVSAP